MSAHAPMPKSAWIFPALAVLLFAARHRDRLRLCALRGRRAVRRRAARDPVRHGVRGRASRRGDRAPDRRTLWDAAADARRHHHRGRADRDADARRHRGAGAGARHGVCGGDDRLQRPRRRLHLRRRHSLPRAGFSGLGGQRLSQRPVHDGDHHAGAARLHPHHARTGLFGGAARSLSASSPSCSTPFFSTPRPAGTGISLSARPPD